jgi:hypothetical protein
MVSGKYDISVKTWIINRIIFIVISIILFSASALIFNGKRYKNFN